MEESNFASFRLESTRKSIYNLKTQKNFKSRKFIDAYSNEELTPELQKATFEYIIAHKGITMYSNPEGAISNITSKEVEQAYQTIQLSALDRFIYFYESYQRKLSKYSQEYIDNSFQDLKTAYHVYRKLNNVGWDLEDFQISESEMTNLYNILTNTKTTNSLEEKQIK